MIRFPTSLEQIKAGEEVVIRAGGTDLVERRRLGLVPGPLVDLRDLPGLDRVEWDGLGGAMVGAKVRIVDVAADEGLSRAYPGFTATAGGLATPQIRAVATLGGNLLQANRCWYNRNPELPCLKSGGDACLARAGDHLYHACFDLGPCACVHPSSLGMALMAYDAKVMVHGASDRSVAELYGDGSNARADHKLEAGAVLTHVVLPPPVPREQAAYFRAISRSRSEWPLVEVLARLVIDGGTISFARVAMGGVAPVPLRLPAVEKILTGATVSPELLAKAATAAKEGADPLPMTGYKVDLIEGTVFETLERATHATPSTIEVKAPAATEPAEDDAPAEGDAPAAEGEAKAAPKEGSKAKAMLNKVTGSKAKTKTKTKTKTSKEGQ